MVISKSSSILSANVHKMQNKYHNSRWATVGWRWEFEVSTSAPSASALINSPLISPWREGERGQTSGRTPASSQIFRRMWHCSTLHHTLNHISESAHPCLKESSGIIIWAVITLHNLAVVHDKIIIMCGIKMKKWNTESRCRFHQSSPFDADESLHRCHTEVCTH